MAAIFVWRRFALFRRFNFPYAFFEHAQACSKKSRLGLAIVEVNGFDDLIVQQQLTQRFSWIL